MPRFWIMSAPDYKSDYKDIYINGSAEHPYGLPGIICSDCGQTWGGWQFLPIPCPEAMRNHPNITHGSPVPDRQHKELQEELRTHLRNEGYDIDRLGPGDHFQPVYLTIPSMPSADMLWPGVSTLIVNERVKKAFEQERFRGVEFCPAILKRAGKRAAKPRPPMPSTGEPEDMLDEVEYLHDTSGVGPLYEMVVTAESGLPPGVGDAPVCPTCGRLNYNDAARSIVMQDDMWRGEDIFLLNTTLYIVVTDRVKQAVEGLGLTNVQFEDATIERPKHLTVHESWFDKLVMRILNRLS